MHFHRINDWDDAYANGPNIPQGERWPTAWEQPSLEYRDAMEAAGRARLSVAYGDRPRNQLDLFLPAGEPKGLVVFVHGGFWLRLDRNSWSHLASGAVRNGHVVAIPSYTLCPDIRIAGITAEIGRAIAHAAALVGGPIRLVGHSAGGHIVTRMVSSTTPLSLELQSRIACTLSISGLHDLRPLLRTAMNATLRLDLAEAMAESPALLEPLPGTRLICWAGSAERSEFLRQNALIANIWKGLGATTVAIEEPDRHHFNIIDGLADRDHPMTQALLTG